MYCEFCGKRINRRALCCKYCGNEVVPNTVQKSEKNSTPILIICSISLTLLCLILAVLLFIQQNTKEKSSIAAPDNDLAGQGAQADNANADLFDETYWLWSQGPTNGTCFYAIFHANGTMDYIRSTDGYSRSRHYEYRDGLLYLSGVAYAFSDGTFTSIEKQEIIQSPDGWYFTLKPDTYQRYRELREKFPATDIDLGEQAAVYVLKKKLANGYWYLYSPQSADCEEYEFSEDTVTIRYRNVMAGTGEYLWENHYVYSVETATGIIKIDGGEWTYDAEHDCIWHEFYDGPADAMRTVYLQHYASRPDLDTMRSDGDVFRAFYKLQDD